jgi:hypothetical protein
MRSVSVRRVLAGCFVLSVLAPAVAKAYDLPLGDLTGEPADWCVALNVGIRQGLSVSLDCDAGTEWLFHIEAGTGGDRVGFGRGALDAFSTAGLLLSVLQTSDTPETGVLPQQTYVGVDCILSMGHFRVSMAAYGLTAGDFGGRDDWLVTGSIGIACFF